MAKTAIVVTPSSMKEFYKIADELKDKSGGFEYELIAVLEYSEVDDNDKMGKCIWCEVPSSTSITAKRNIGRYLVSEGTKYLIFLGEKELPINKKWLTDRIRGFEVEPVLGIIGKLAEPVDMKIQDTLLKKLRNFIHILDEDFYERCCLKDKTFRYVEEDSIATTVKVFDLIGGFSVTAEYPNLEYNARVQSLGYGLLPQPE